MISEMAQEMKKAIRSAIQGQEVECPCTILCTVLCKITRTTWSNEFFLNTGIGKTEDERKAAVTFEKNRIKDSLPIPGLLGSVSASVAENLDACLQEGLTSVANREAIAFTCTDISETFIDVERCPDGKPSLITVVNVVWYVTVIPPDEVKESLALIQSAIWGTSALKLSADEVLATITNHELGHIAVDLTWRRLLCAITEKKLHDDVCPIQFGTNKALELAAKIAIEDARAVLNAAAGTRGKQSTDYHQTEGGQGAPKNILDPEHAADKSIRHMKQNSKDVISADEKAHLLDDAGLLLAVRCAESFILPEELKKK